MTSKWKPRLLLADDPAIVTEGLTRLLEAVSDGRPRCV
jgi:hypothetical protein